MSIKTQAALKALEDAVREESNEHCISFRVFINSQEVQTEYNHRTPELLRRIGSSMRNLRGKFIE